MGELVPNKTYRYIFKILDATVARRAIPYNVFQWFFAAALL